MEFTMQVDHGKESEKLVILEEEKNEAEFRTSFFFLLSTSFVRKCKSIYFT